jgi:energy-coupling factor transport system permease protein
MPLKPFATAAVLPLEVATMLNNLPIGVYLAGTSPVHRLRARTKLLLLVWFAGGFFIANHKMFHYGVYAVAFVAIALALILARVDTSYIWRRMRVLVILLAISIPFSLMWTPGDTWHTFGPLVLHFYHVHLGIGPIQISITHLDLPIGPIVVTYDGIWFTISYTAIFLLLYLCSITLTLTTTPVALAEGVVLLLRPFRWLRIPAEEFGLMTLVSLRFVPVLVQETEQLIKAQISRGADFTTGSLSTRVRRLGTLLVPLVQGALRRAEGLSSALEARGYGVTGAATLLHEGPLRLLDWLTLIGIPALTILAFWRL